MGTRKATHVTPSLPVIEGAGVHLKRAFGFDEAPGLDPFLLLDDFHSNKPEHYLMGFPWHPHRGIETITYVLHGTVEHGDSMGNRGAIGEGDVQWMTAGSGIVHQEMPHGDRDKLLRGFQLWANLPASHKMMEPRYRSILAGQIPAVRTPDGTEVRVICGSFGAKRGPAMEIVIDPEYLDISLAKGTLFSHQIAKGRSAFAYVFEGTVVAGGAEAATDHLIRFGDGNSVALSAPKDRARLILVSGNPINEPVAWGGPIVMNTEEELRQAFEEYRAGTFLKHK